MNDFQKSQFHASFSINEYKIIPDETDKENRSINLLNANHKINLR